MQTIETVDEVLGRLRAIDASLPPDDGVAVFNRMYLTVTERIGDLVGAGTRRTPFRDAAAMAELDVRFARLWLDAHDADAAGSRPASAWRPLFEERAAGRLPVQYAIAGMNSHIEHDLPLAVTETCTARGCEPDDLHADYEAVNVVLASVESEVRRSFLSDVGRAVDDRIGPVVHVLSAWNIDKARDLSWVTTQTLWALRGTRILRGRFADALAHTVGMTTRVLLAPGIEDGRRREPS
ncbi:hypothetical protein CLV56_2874 [Mumia flava]|uniref:Uncharacterized protein n=1 Tax=Mumia flava TaxID=1348852 RepID=A0A0B2B463_9ACTN|nr:DUF5995 family protein [Mumia flava]PJJ53385.1 hypothetical protein CLV56_2874 [Mumia flava]